MDRPKGMPLNPDYVIAYTTGKVGSTSIMETLRSVNVPCHRCEKHNISQYHRKDWPTISAVRDPIAWIFSHIFERVLSMNQKILPEHAPEYVRLIQHGELNPVLMDYCNWWATSFRQTTGVNIYGQRWVKRKPWKIFSIRALVLRTDKIDEVFAEALTEFLPPYYPDIDMSTLKVQHRAKGSERFDGYEEFMDAVSFDLHWLAKFYDNDKMSNFFFFREEQQKWLKKWSKRK